MSVIVFEHVVKEPLTQQSKMIQDFISQIKRNFKKISSIHKMYYLISLIYLLVFWQIYSQIKVQNKIKNKINLNFLENKTIEFVFQILNVRSVSLQCPYVAWIINIMRYKMQMVVEHKPDVEEITNEVRWYNNGTSVYFILLFIIGLHSTSPRQNKHCHP